MWEERDNALHASLDCGDFVTAFAFMTEAAFAIERDNHHPEWSNVYGKIDIKLTTHDAGNTVTDKDRKLAKALEVIYSRYKK